MVMETHSHILAPSSICSGNRPCFKRILKYKKSLPAMGIKREDSHQVLSGAGGVAGDGGGNRGGVMAARTLVLTVLAGLCVMVVLTMRFWW